MSQRQPITVAFSPDTDDAFMVHAMRAGLVDSGPYDFSFTAADIQELNEKATRGVYDITAISVAAYPSIAQNYLLMPVGASIGDAFGPALIVRQDSPAQSLSDLVGRRIAIPGRQTSAFVAARGLIGSFADVPMSFLNIGSAVQAGTVDAGILIHELQLNCEKHGFRKLGDLGQLWHARYGLPLPLGANAIRQSLGPAVITELTGIMRLSIEVGLENRSQTIAAALLQSKAELDQDGGDRYISMYVNHRSLALKQDVKEAMAQLFAIGRQAGLNHAVNLSEALYE